MTPEQWRMVDEAAEVCKLACDQERQAKEFAAVAQSFLDDTSKERQAAEYQYERLVARLRAARCDEHGSLGVPQQVPGAGGSAIVSLRYRANRNHL